ncbi:MAG: OmpH family outer membrane protein [Sedimentisphaerales bacterium]|nr:OmpH family outer membrane protein [Sedimentisphaerales bacterium]
MKTVAILICVAALFAILPHGYAASEPASGTPKIGVVSIRAAFNTSKRLAFHRSQLLQVQSRGKAQLDDMARDADAEEAGLKALKEGTPDYMKQLQTILKKRADLDSQREYLKQQLLLEEKNGMEALYQDTLKIVQALAKEKGLTIVFERTEPEFPISSEELRLTFSTHKVLYADGCVDLTQEVATRLDAAGGAQPSK